MIWRSFLTWAVLLIVCGAQSPSGKIKLDVLYLGKPESARARAFESLFEKHFRKVVVASRDGGRKEAGPFDVVVLDWPQNASAGFKGLKSPLGERAEWSKPTVLIGSAGLNLSAVWNIRGGFG